MKTLMVVYLLLLISSLSYGQTVSTNANASATVDGLSIEHRPSKIFRCWGGPDQSSNFSAKHDDSSKENSGDMSLHDGAFNSDYKPMNLRWNSDYADQTFSVDFIYDVASPARNDTHSDCSDNENYRHVKSVSANVQSSVEVTVPPSVWFVRIERQDISSDFGHVVSKLSGSNSLRSIQADLPENENISRDGTNFYYSTKPGDKITLTMNWSQNAVESRRVTSKFKLSFVGKDHCEALVKEFSSTKYSQLTKLFAAESSSNLLLTMGCLLNDEIGTRVLKANDPSEVSSVLDKVEKIGLTEDMTMLGAGNLAVKLISQFVYYKIAYMALNDITTLCNKTKIDDPLESSDGLTVNGFIVNHYFLSRILFRLKAFDLARFSAFIDVLNERAKSVGSYSKLKNSKGDFDRVYKAYNILKASMSLGSGSYSLSSLPFTSTLYYFDHLKLHMLNQNAFEEMRAKLVSLSGREEKFKREFGEIKWKLATAPDDQIDTSVFSQDLKELSAKSSEVIGFFESEKQWFDTPDPTVGSSPYISDMTHYMIMVRHFAESTQDLDLIKHRPDFLAAYNPADPLKGVNACLFSGK
jgi:hypothetical protein